jgi:predicted phage terminase large subunit-like protein
MSDKRVRAIAEAAAAEISRRSLLDFAARMVPSFSAPAHIRRIAELLEDVEAGRKLRVVITVPPRHGKSRLLQIAEAWYLGRNPSKNAITSSHSAELAERNSRFTRALVEQYRWPFEARLSADSSAVHRWNLTPGGGGLYAVGAGGSITGRGADLLVLDDIQHDTGTDVERDSAWEWFSETAIPRLEPGAAIVVLATRWHETDVVGRLLAAPDADQWTVLSLPALAESDDPLGRAEGEALWPERFSLNELNARRVSMGARAFESQFQQNPAPSEGNLFRAVWLTKRYRELPKLDNIALGLDAAWKTGPQHDFSAMLIAGSNATDYYLIDVIRGKWEYPHLRRLLSEICEKHHPKSVCVEDAASGTAIIQELTQSTRLPIIPIQARGSKEARAEAITPILEAGKLWLPESAPWLDAFESELLRFPAGAHDDQVDALVLTLTRLSARRRIVGAWVSDSFSNFVETDGPGPGVPVDTRHHLESFR